MLFVDRRKTAKNKSAPNRQALIKRIKQAIRNSSPNQIGTSVGNVGGTSTSPVAIARNVLHEPTFHYNRSSGTYQVVVVGNDQFERGDKIPSNSGGSGSGKGQDAGNSGGGEDDFLVQVSTDEFLSIFFEDCELPNMEETSERVIPELQPRHAGFTRDGNPASLRVVRSYKQALPRRKILTKNDTLELLELQEELDELENAEQTEEVRHTIEEIQIKINQLKTKIANVPFFEKMDLRYAKTERQLVKTADAVFVMIMDISGSMDEDKKKMARKFFALQYAFIKRKYPNTDLVFIAHTEEAFEMDESEFFSTRISGGTIVSSSYDMALDIINKRYDHTITNIYISQASDGDNYLSDNARVQELLLKPNGVLSKVRHMSYANLGPVYASTYGDSLRDVMMRVKGKTNKLSIASIANVDDVFPQFKKIYQKTTSNS